jgi:hypothetical protein
MRRLLKYLCARTVRARVYLLAICLVLGQSRVTYAKSARDHEDPNQGGGRKQFNPDGKKNTGNSDQGCGVSPSDLADFAKGTAFRYPTMVNFLSSPDCLESTRSITQATLSVGNIKFNDKGPLRLDRFADQLRADELQSAARVDSLVARTFPALLRENPVPTRDLLPLAAQVALLSPTAAREVWVTVIQQELVAGDDLINNAGSDGQRKVAATTLAESLEKMGVEQPVIARAMASRIQDLALMVQVDNLSKMFRALGAAAGADADLVQVLNLSAGALSRGVQRGDKMFSSLERKDLMKTVFVALKASLGISEELDQAGNELNDAVAVLSKGTGDFKKLTLAWNQALDILGQTATQATLAKAVSYSLTPDVIFLSPQQGQRLIAAAKNYPVMAFSIQRNYLDGLLGFDKDRGAGQLSDKAWNQIEKNFLGPLASQIVALSSDRIDPVWLREASNRGFLQADDIEKRFPRLVLAYLNQRENKMKSAVAESDAEAGVSMMAQNLAVLWTLSNVHYPALMNWAKAYEQKQ